MDSVLIDERVFPGLSGWQLTATLTETDCSLEMKGGEIEKVTRTQKEN